jgi:hypothetical protein
MLGTAQRQVRPVTVPDLRSMLVGLGTDAAGCRAGLRRDFRPEGPPQASDAKIPLQPACAGKGSSVTA